MKAGITVSGILITTGTEQISLSPEVVSNAIKQGRC